MEYITSTVYEYSKHMKEEMEMMMVYKKSM